VKGSRGSEKGQGCERPYVGVKEPQRSERGPVKVKSQRTQRGPLSTLPALLVTSKKVMTKKVASILDGERKGSGKGTECVLFKADVLIGPHRCIGGGG